MAAPSIRLITTSKAPAATGYSQAVLVNNQTLYVSGQTGMISGKTDVVPGGARAEAKQAMTNIGEILTYAGSSFKHVINCNIMVTNMNDFQDVNETFKNFFTADTYPARSFFQVVKLPKNALVMIDAVAVVAGQENVKKTVLQKRISMNNFEAGTAQLAAAISPRPARREKLAAGPTRRGAISPPHNSPRPTRRAFIFGYLAARFFR
ncbi:hypothetical protein niasHT_028376 [Heterodera trifolii]|uniref:Uncharacterized protein n=1 Tax=Heterodera trifolii TaxID=157864 RepID=A0ABD2JIH2_9BILA